MPRASKLGDWLLLICCNFIWASQFVLLKIVQVQLGPVAATALPMLLATLFLFPIVAVQRRRSGNRPRVGLRDIIQFILLGVLGQVAAQLFVTWGMRYSPASNAALLSLALPVVTALMAYLILREHMSAVRWISFALALIGVLECSGIEWSSLTFSGSSSLLGNLLIFGSVVGSAFYNVYGKKMLETYTPLEVLLYSYYAVVAVLIPLTLRLEPKAYGLLAHLAPKVWIGLFLLAVFQYFLSMVVFLRVLSRLDAIQASLSNYMIPFFGVLIAAAVLHETLTLPMMIGGALVLLSTLLVTVYEERLQRSRDAKTVQARKHPSYREDAHP